MKKPARKPAPSKDELAALRAENERLKQAAEPKAVPLSDQERAGLQRLLSSLAAHQDAVAGLTLLIQQRVNQTASAHGINLDADEVAGWSWQLDPDQKAFHRTAKE